MQLFAKAEKIYPRRVSGTFRNLKWLSMIVLLGIYYGAPWLRYDRGPHVPNQAILIDLVGQRGYFFGIEIWPQEVYILVGVLVLAAIGLFFATSLLGRVWCGYACPQTVWTDLFVWVERFVQGDRNARKKLDESPLSFGKLYKKSLTHLIWLVIGLVTGGAWVFYFNDAPTLVDKLLHGFIDQGVLVWVIALTFSTYFMAGYARENVCTYACPYARFQSAMFDRDTLIIQYATERGEPRGKHKKGEPWEGRGHCVDCEACVVVCPMGIDIRNGLQYQCISCGLCIDACNQIMEKLDLPRGLIHYDTENNQEKRAAQIAAHQKPWKGKMFWLRARTLYYALILSVIGGLMSWAILNRQPLELNVIHNRSPLYVKMSDGSIRNNYQFKVLNKSHDDKAYSVKINGLDHPSVTLLGAGDEAVDTLKVPANAVGEFRVMVVKPQGTSPRSDVEFIITDVATGDQDTHKSYFVEQ